MRSTQDILTCDRCGHEEIIPPARYERGYPWAKIVAQQSNGPLKIGDMNGPTALKETKDLCESCMKSLMSWWGMAE